VPGVISPGRPNDYINMFLEESKTWMRDQMTLDAVHAEELARRDNFYTKLKNDNYFWYGILRSILVAFTLQWCHFEVAIFYFPTTSLFLCR
jgi:hypothetical protein